MASIESRVRDLNAKRLRAWEHGKEILDRAVAANRGMTADERKSYDATSDEVSRIDRERDSLLSSDAARAESSLINEEFRRVLTPSDYRAARQGEKEALADFLTGRRASLDFDLRAATYATNAYRDGARGNELRGIFGDAGGGSLSIPSLVSSEIFQTMLSRNAMRRTRMKVITSDSGGPLVVPVVSQGLGTQVASQNTAFAGTDPTMASAVLQAFDAGELVAIGNDLLEDSGTDVLGWVSQNIAMAVATLEETWMVAGTGSGQPLGIMAAGGTGSAGTVATSGSLVLGPAGAVVEKLIDVQYSVNSAYRAVGEWLVHDNTAAAMRKIRVDGGGTVGAFAWSPSPTVGLIGGMPDTFLGNPIHVSSNVASMASSAVVAGFGDFSAYWAREVRGFRLERSTDLYFDKNQTALRGLTRVDSTLTDKTAFNRLRQAVG